MPVATFPLDLTAPLAAILIGFAFGFTLESSGFGDARRLAAQFYFRESRVVKVMFTAIVTCMLLLLWGSALGWIDLGRIWINPTYLGSGILGGFILGIGFIVGGYCPGTSIVSAATLKKDGILFLLGVAAGSTIFGWTADAFRTFYDGAGYLGRVTLPAWLGLPAGVVAILVLFMAIGMFWFFDLLGQSIGKRSARGGAEPHPQPPTTWHGLWVPAIRGGGLALVLFLLAAFLLPVVGQPTLGSRLVAMQDELDGELAAGTVRIDPVEHLGLMHAQIHDAPGRFRLVTIDVRDEVDFNLFHLVDAERIPLDALRGPAGLELAGEDYETAIKVLVSNDEEAALEAWRILRAQGVLNVYVLRGGMNLWLDVFQAGDVDARPAEPPVADESLRHPFTEALGSRYPYARPSEPVYRRIVAGREPAWKVRPIVKAPAASGGCG